MNMDLNEKISDYVKSLVSAVAAFCLGVMNVAIATETQPLHDVDVAKESSSINATTEHSKQLRQASFVSYRNSARGLERITAPDGLYLAFGTRLTNGNYASIVMYRGTTALADFTARQLQHDPTAGHQKRASLEDDFEDILDVDGNPLYYNFLTSTLDLDVSSCFGWGPYCPSPRQQCLDTCAFENEIGEAACRGLGPTGAALCWAALYLRYGQCVRGC